MLSRNVAACMQVRDEIRATCPRATVDVLACDLSSLASVRKAAANLLAGADRIGLLVNNAGMVSSFHRMSEDGFELTFATNHLGPFLLTSLLLPRMTDSGRIVTVSSRAHLRGALDLEQVCNPRARYSSVKAYAQSKLANVLHTFALARRLSGSGITVNCLHPGVVATHLLPWWLRQLKPLISPVIFDAGRGARTSLHLALSSEVSALSGYYFDEYQKVVRAGPVAYDESLQELLWERSTHWVGLSGT